MKTSLAFSLLAIGFLIHYSAAALLGAETPGSSEHQWVIRENLMRHRDNVSETYPDLGAASPGIRLEGSEDALIQENVIDLGNPNLIQHLFSKNIRSFNNQTPSGQTIFGHDEDLDPIGTTQRDNELESVIEDAILLAL